ncbi:hypothetical protein BDN72DRAFT_899204 [Pluteus cervinus]|uniref:Uncharacterized protein n=1 Tax=Pluteus cervinus TaxID=181527 RepID=A0ACD3APH5_9AGAR|nr:hypothetical protein BDN72DRAFT_899204 [Pluteus cervinus]
MRTNFFIAATVFALASFGQSRVILRREVASSFNRDDGGIGEFGHIIIEVCSQFPEKCHTEELRSESSTDATAAAEGIPLLGGLLGGAGGGLLGGVLGLVDGLLDPVLDMVNS